MNRDRILLEEAPEAKRRRKMAEKGMRILAEAAGGNLGLSVQAPMLTFHSLHVRL